MQKKQTVSFDNEVRISGTITKKDNFVNLIPFPVFGFELRSNKKVTDADVMNGYTETADIHRAIIFDNEDFINEFEIGDRILIKGEIQSRNFSQKHSLPDGTVQNAVDLYKSLFENLPVDKEPTQYFRQPIVWSHLMEYNLIDGPPNDSAFDETQSFLTTEQTPYTYKLDWNGEVSKETEETIYEIIVLSYEKLEEESNAEDINEVRFLGRVSTDPIFDIEGALPVTKFTAQAYLNYFKNREKRYAFLPFLIEGLESEDVFKNIKKNDFVEVLGSFNSRTEKKILRLKKVKASGKSKTKKVEIDELKRFVTIKSIKKQLP